MKKYIIAGAIMTALTFAVMSTAPVSAAPYCGITWGSQPKTIADRGYGETLRNIRTGRNACYDRMVFDVSSATTGYDVRYVANVRTDGSGEVIPLRGGAKLRVIARSPSYTENGTPTYDARTGAPLPGVNLTGYRTFRDAKFAGSFEGQSTVGLGVRARLPFRVFILDNRVVVDVAHRW